MIYKVLGHRYLIYQTDWQYFLCSIARTVLCNVTSVTDEEAWEIAITSNIARKQLDLYDEMFSYDRLKEFGRSDSYIAKITSTTRRRVNVLLRIARMGLEAQSEIKEYIGSGVDYTTLRVVSKLPSDELISLHLGVKVKEGSSVSRLQDRVNNHMDYLYLESQFGDHCVEEPFYQFDEEGDFRQNYWSGQLTSVFAEQLEGELDYHYLRRLFDKKDQFNSLSFENQHNKLKDNLAKDSDDLKEIRIKLLEVLDLCERSHYYHDEEEEALREATIIETLNQNEIKKLEDLLPRVIEFDKKIHPDKYETVEESTEIENSSESDDLQIEGTTSEFVADLGEKKEAITKIIESEIKPGINFKNYSDAKCPVCGENKKLKEFELSKLQRGIGDDDYLAGICIACVTRKNGEDETPRGHVLKLDLDKQHSIDFNYASQQLKGIHANFAPEVYAECEKIYSQVVNSALISSSFEK